MQDAPRAFWSMPTADVMSALQSSANGLTGEAAAERLAHVGPNVLGERKRSDAPTLLLRQVTSPLVLLLVAAALLSFALHDPTDGVIILGIVGVSALLGFWQERGAAMVVEKLLATVAAQATVLRDGHEIEIAVVGWCRDGCSPRAPASRRIACCSEQDLFVVRPRSARVFPWTRHPG